MTLSNSPEYQDVMEALRMSRAYTVNLQTWFAPALFGSRIHLSKEVQVAAISERLDIFFNPDAVRRIAETAIDKRHELSQLGFLWLHEIAHVLREHPGRCRARSADNRLWNIAADCEINDSTWDGFLMPVDFPGILPSTFGFPDHQLTETYYELLKDKRAAQSKAAGGENAEQGQNKQGDGTGQPEASPENEIGKNPTLAEILALTEGLDEGSGAHGEARPWELEVSGDDEHTSVAEVESIRRDVARQMEEAESIRRGTIPANWRRWAKDKLEEKVDWRKVLLHRVRTAVQISLGGKIDYSYARPHRRQATYAPLIVPSLRGDTKVKLACVLDTSGSMSAAQIGQGVSEIMKILLTLNSSIFVLPCDAVVNEVIEIAKASDQKKLVSLLGGGGTDMVGGVLAALQLKPDVVVVLTDGYTDYPSAPYKTPVIFCIIKKRPNDKPPMPNVPPWNSTSIVEIVLENSGI